MINLNYKVKYVCLNNREWEGLMITFQELYDKLLSSAIKGDFEVNAGADYDPYHLVYCIVDI